MLWAKVNESIEGSFYDFNERDSFELLKMISLMKFPSFAIFIMFVENFFVLFTANPLVFTQSKMMTKTC